LKSIGKHGILGQPITDAGQLHSDSSAAAAALAARSREHFLQETESTHKFGMAGRAQRVNDGVFEEAEEFTTKFLYKSLKKLGV